MNRKLLLSDENYCKSIGTHAQVYKLVESAGTNKLSNYSKKQIVCGTVSGKSSYAVRTMTTTQRYMWQWIYDCDDTCKKSLLF